MNLSNQTKELLNSTIQLRKALNQVLPKDLVEYIIELIARDQAHQKYLESMKENK